MKWVIWIAALSLAMAAALLDRARYASAGLATAEPFLTLAAVILAGQIGERVGLFRLLARVLIPPSAQGPLSAAAVLTFTALVSGLVNLDVAVVVATPMALRVAERNQLAGSRLVVATALTANATSFLLPTSNLTNLLVLNRSPLAPWTYLEQSWLAWMLVTVLTVAALAVLAGRRSEDREGPSSDRRASAPVLVDLVPMFLGASAIRALLGTGLALPGGFVTQVAGGSLLAAVANNLPAAAAVQVAGGSGRWAAVLAMAIGPNLLLTGSVASLICRRIARDRNQGFGAGAFTLLGSALLPLQILVAILGLHLTGALG